jgi:hypothetical protein
MATTTNYGWETPDDTDLVKDGAAAIRTLGSSIDTTTKNLNPETTLGDIAYRSSTSNTNTRLAIGSNGQVLTVASGVPSWATPASTSGLTLVSTTTLSASGSFNITSCFSTTYDDYFVFIDEIVGSTASFFTYGLRTGSTNATANYKYVNYQYNYTGSNQSAVSTGASEFGALDYATTNADAGSIFLTLRAPFLAKATQCTIQKNGNDRAGMSNVLHADATSYESMWFTVTSGTISGKVRIYGLAK